MRRRRLLATAAVILIAAAAGGLTLGLRSGGGGDSGTVNYAADGLAVRYPSALTRVDWCWSGPHFSPIAILTTAQPTPKCTKPGGGLRFPPAERLGDNGVSVELANVAVMPGVRRNWNGNARVGDQPANVETPVYDRSYHGRITCPAGDRREFRSVAIMPNGGDNGLFTISAVICGPDLAAGNRSVDGILASLRFSG